MAQELKADSGRKFAGDMRRIRESRHISIDDLHEETKIPIGLLEAFEDTALFDHPQFNRVYLRSFVRTYANVVDVDADVALAALEDALGDKYAGSLAADYLDESIQTIAESPEETEGAERLPEERVSKPAIADEPSAAPGRQDDEAPAPERSDADGSRRSASFRADTRHAADAGRGPRPPKREDQIRRRADDAEGHEPPRRKDRDASPGATLTGAAAGAAGGASMASEAADTDESEWTTQSPPRSRAASQRPTQAAARRGGRAARSSGGAGPWLAAAAILAAVVVVIWFIASSTGDEPVAQQETTMVGDTTTAAETAATADPTVDSRPVMPTLGDTLNVQIVAANEKVDPIRVTVDDDLRRPYWIELGDSMTFRPTERIVIEEDLDAIALRIEGAEYPTTRRDDLGRIVINRDSLRAYFRSNGAE